jgi:hypothetical protein
MLAGYVALLREAVRADAELRQAREGTAHAVDAERRRAVTRPVGAPARGATDGRVAGSSAAFSTGAGAGARIAAAAGGAAGADETATAEVVDITSRMDGEPYDQYADAKLRAVGD